MIMAETTVFQGVIEHIYENGSLIPVRRLLLDPSAESRARTNQLVTDHMQRSASVYSRIIRRYIVRHVRSLKTHKHTNTHSLP